MITVIRGSKIIGADLTVTEGDIVISEGKISYVGSSYAGPYDDVIDAQGLYASPGFIDIHLHGGDGYDFMDASAEEFLKIAAFHAKFGTTAMVPTMVSGDIEKTKHVLRTYLKAKKLDNQGARFLGLHLEGPYVSKERSGALDPAYIHNPDIKECEELLSIAEGNIVRWTIAPELDGAMTLGEKLAGRGVIASVGHSDAKMCHVTEALSHGFSLITHFYSCMSTVTRDHGYRSGGVIEAGLYHDVDVEVISDNRHLPPELLKMIYKIKGYQHIALVTDAMRGAGKDHGIYMLGAKEDGIPAIIEDGVAKLMDRSAFAGSVATTDRLVRTMYHEAGVPLAEAVYMMSYKPAEIMGCADQIGSIDCGKLADIVLFDDQIQVQLTMIHGETVYESSSFVK